MPKKDAEAMTRWDHFAAAVLAGAAANPNTGCNAPRDFAHWAGQVADAMMRERAKRMAELDAAP